MNKKTGKERGSSEINKDKVISSPDTVPVLFHDKRLEFMKLLIEKEMTIIDLKNATNLNPGTIKRHLTNLVEHGLVIQTRIETNIYGVKMKFYRATAKQFIVDIKWPPTR